MADAEEVGLTKVCEVVDNGGAVVGNPLSLVSKAFLERMRQADMIVGKGQGNYETLSGSRRAIYYLLRVKCPVLARDLNCPVGSMALRRSDV